MQPIHFITFSGGNAAYRYTGRRLIKEIRKSKLFSTFELLVDRDLMDDDEFYLNHKILYESNLIPRGFGGWIWKPYIISKKLSEIPEGEILLYLDAGCHFNVSTIQARNKFKFYFEETENKGSYLTQIRDNQFLEGFNIKLYCEKYYSHPDLVKKININELSLESNQIEANFIFLKNNQVNRNFINSWYQLCLYDNYSYLRPQTFFIENYKCETNFDQSIFSLLAKKFNLNYVENETYFYPDWNLYGKFFPIWTTRIRNRASPINPYSFWNIYYKIWNIFYKKFPVWTSKIRKFFN